MERLSAVLAAVNEGAGAGEFEAIAASLGVANSAHGPTRFSAEALAAAPREVPLVWNHDVTEPIGIASLSFDPKEGLVARGRLALALVRAREARSLLMQGALNEASVGFSSKQQRMEGGVRVIDAADIQELSLVCFPADPAATVRWIHRGTALEDLLDPRWHAKREYEMVKDLQAARRRPDWSW